MFNTADLATIEKGTAVTITLTDDTFVEGLFISVNSKGVNLKDADGKTVTRSLAKIADIAMTDMDEDTEADMIADEFVSGGTDDLADDVTDEGGMTASEAAAVFGVPATELRKVTRALGLGVGRGRRYLLDGDDLKKIRTEMAKVEAEAAKADATA